MNRGRKRGAWEHEGSMEKGKKKGQVRFSGEVKGG
jgi:hypothetical protein